jgi:hypothetical protein
LQGRLRIARHTAEIDRYFATYGIAAAIRASLIGIAWATRGVRAGGEEMRLFVESYLVVALTQRLEDTSVRGIEFCSCARRRRAGVAARGLARLDCLDSRSLSGLLSPSRRDLDAVFWHRWRGRQSLRGTCRCATVHVE